MATILINAAFGDVVLVSGGEGGEVLISVWIPKGAVLI